MKKIRPLPKPPESDLMESDTELIDCIISVGYRIKELMIYLPVNISFFNKIFFLKINEFLMFLCYFHIHHPEPPPTRGSPAFRACILYSCKIHLVYHKLFNKTLIEHKFHEDINPAISMRWMDAYT
jgi:hypothetical protein